MNVFKSMVSIIFLTVILSGCTSMRQIENISTQQEILKSINPGDLIHVETVGGSKHEILVKSISLESVKGESIEIPLDQIKTVKKEQVSGLKTAGAIVGGYVLYAGLAILVFLASL